MIRRIRKMGIIGAAAIIIISIGLWGEICYGRSYLYRYILTRSKREEQLYMKMNSPNKYVFNIIIFLPAQGKI